MQACNREIKIDANEIRAERILQGNPWKTEIRVLVAHCLLIQKGSKNHENDV